MTSVKSSLVCIALLFFLNGIAQKTIDTIAIQSGSFAIPIKIQLPSKTTAKSPIYFFVHGDPDDML